MYVCWFHAVLSITWGGRISCYLRSRPACSDSGSGPARRVARSWASGCAANCACLQLSCSAVLA